MKIFLIVLCFSFTGTAFSNNFEKCSLADKTCLDRAIGKAVQYLSEKGLPELNISKIDPIDISQINIGTKSNALDVAQKYLNVNLVGYRNAKIGNSQIDIDKKVIKFTAFLPELKQIANYDISGRLLIFPVFGEGKSTITQTNVTVIHKIQFENEMERNRHLKVKNYTISITPENTKFKFDNLFNGNKLLSERVHIVINENWEIIWADARKDIEKSYGKVFQNFARKFFDVTPVSEIFLDFPS